MSVNRKNSTYCDPVIPERYITLVPLEPGMNLWAGCHNLSQKTDDVIRLRLWYTNNLCHEAWVKEDTLPARDGVCSDERVFGGDRVAAYSSSQIARALGLELSRV